MTCCGASACESQFDHKRAARELKNYRAQGPAHPTTRAMIHLLRRAGVDGSTLLDIGGGIGAIQYDLLAAREARRSTRPAPINRRRAWRRSGAA